MKKIISCAVASALLGTLAMGQKTTTTKAGKTTTPEVVSKVVLKNHNDSFSYATGMSIAGYLKTNGVKEVNGEILLKAINDELKNIPTPMTAEVAQKCFQDEMGKLAKQKTDVEKERGMAFLAQNKSRKEIITLPDGLQYEIMEAGEATGPKPKAIDTVVVHYVGTLIDGQEFDNSVKRGQPATFPVGGVIKGWTEILQLMTKGAKWKVYIPSELAYGERGAGGSIPPNSVLVFEVNLIDIKPAAEIKQ